jgi:hypothetical protein
MKRTLRLALACALLACAQDDAPRTELMLVVDSDLTVPAQLDEITISAEGPGALHHEANAALGSRELPLPRSLALVHEQGELGPIAILVEGKLAGKTIVQREAEVSFVRGHTLVLPMHLVRACRGVTCESGETCSERGCESVDIDESELDAWTGEKPMLADAGVGVDDAGEEDPQRDAGKQDAAVMDASAPRDAGRDAGNDAGDACARAETCNGRDDNCNRKIDEGFDLQLDEANCGSCGTVCDARRAEMCCAGVCTRTACR